MREYYVYLFLRADMVSPYYVGKGTGGRINSNNGRKYVKTPLKEQRRKVFITENEEEALLVEKKLIEFYGRKSEGGILENRAEGGQKPMSLRGHPKTPEWKKALSLAAKERWKREGVEQLREQGRKTAAMINTPEHLEKMHKRSVEACTLTHKVEKGGVVEYLTKKEFIAKYGGNLGSLKQQVWRIGHYKGWKFSK